MFYQNPHGPSCPWYEITEKHGAANIKWCEETLCQWISEPANTWSNLGFIIIGCLITFLAIKNKNSTNLKMFGPIVIIVGITSLVYHLSNFYLTQILDFLGMFFFVSWAFGMNLVRLNYLSNKNLKWLIVGISLFYTIVLHTMYLTGMKFQVIVLVSGFLIVITEYLARKKQKVSYGWFAAAVVLLVTAFSFSISDHTRVWCDSSQHGWFTQGHALWHWIGSLAMFAIYKHYDQPAIKA